MQIYTPKAENIFSVHVQLLFARLPRAVMHTPQRSIHVLKVKTFKILNICRLLFNTLLWIFETRILFQFNLNIQDVQKYL